MINRQEGCWSPSAIQEGTRAPGQEPPQHYSRTDWPPCEEVARIWKAGGVSGGALEGGEQGHAQLRQGHC